MELIRDLPWKSLSVAVFGDVGNAFDSFGDPLMYSVGVGVRLRLPVVSVGIDVAQALTIPAGQHRASRVRACISISRRNCDEARLKIAALVFGSLVLVVVSLLAWVIYTEAGLRFAVARLPEKLGKVTLQIEDVRGTIAGGFSAVLVDVDHELTSRAGRERPRRACNFWPIAGRAASRCGAPRRTWCWSRSSVARRTAAETTPRFLPRLLSISAERATRHRCW